MPPETAPEQGARMWCDTFDADLLAVVPGAAEALGPAAGAGLLTYSPTTGGKINCPSAWNTDEGLASFFWTSGEYRLAGAWYTDEPVVECTFLEVVRDEWVHSCTVVVNGLAVWKPPARLMEQLMYDVRAWTPLSGEERDEVQRNVRCSLAAAAERLAQVPGVPSFAAGSS